MKNAIIILLCAFALVGCKKYEGDFTLRTPEARIKGEWVLMDSGCSDFFFNRVRFDRRGESTVIDGPDSYRVYWEFQQNKERLELWHYFVDENIDIRDEYQIKILSNKEMELILLSRYSDNGDFNGEPCTDQRLIFSKQD